MKYFIHHNESFPPHYDLILDSGGAIETFRIPEDFFFDLVSGSPVEYEEFKGTDIKGAAISCEAAKVAVEDSGDYTVSKSGNIILKGGRITGELVIERGSRKITLIPG
ncbi:MAG: hypothetical protein GXY14_07555 [Spirochaetes bacterium]|nr:hypothetical protein [Spirochaetota bacterium]